PVVYVMPKDGYTKDNSGITTKLFDAIKAGEGMDMIVVRPTFEKGDDLQAELKWLVNEIDSKYRTTGTVAHRAIIGTDAGGYMAYMGGLTGNTPELFSFIASINGNMVNNPWYATYGDLYGKLNKGGSSSISKYFTYLDAPVDGAWTNQKNSSADISNMMIGFGLLPSQSETTIRHLKDGETLEDFMTESVNRVADRFTTWAFSGAASGSVSLEKTVMLASESNAKVNYSVNTTSVLNTYVSDAVDMQIIVSVVDPKTGDVLAEKVADTVKVSGAATFSGSTTVPNKVNGDSSNIVLSVKLLSTDIELATATLIRGKSATNTAIDLMGDWYFNFMGKKTINMGMITEAEFSTWSVAQPGLAWWTKGFGNINDTTVSVPGYMQAYFDYMIIGNGYYAKTFTVPAGFARENIMVSIGRVDDRTEVYVNGKRIGGTGITEAGASTGDSAWESYSAFPIDASLLNYGGKNTIVVRDINDGMGGGGWYEGPIGLYAGESFDEINPEAYDPHFYEETFESKYAAKLLGKPSPYDNPYLIYLPESYYETDRYYPTVYLMHQYNSTHTSYKTDKVNELFEEGVKNGMFDEFIVVIPNSQESSWWRGDWQKMVVEELIPHIDENYRTIKDARYRLTAGCSMGGQGAMGVALCNPDYFSGAISFFGAFSMGGDTSPLNVASKESAEYLDNFAMYFICGNQDIYQFGQPAIELNQMLDEMGVDHYFFIENGEHNSAFYIPFFQEAFEYTRDEMYLADAAVKNMVYGDAAVTKKDGKVYITPSFAVKSGFENYFNTIPDSSYTGDQTPDLNIPLVLTIKQNGTEQKIVIRDHTLARGTTVNVLDPIDITSLIDPNKTFTLTYECALFHHDLVELKPIPDSILAGANLPETGDDSNIVLYGAAFLASLMALLVISKKRVAA
ncbi:MAG: LPXTG cell wall anchor domain-containing protein, partial [Clostridia bacterium]|nr:LPXTG cell wall anchor domain-containing protein [Clostridia bacterium]